MFVRYVRAGDDVNHGNKLQRNRLVLDSIRARDYPFFRDLVSIDNTKCSGCGICAKICHEFCIQK
jgi:ferredoxin